MKKILALTFLGLAGCGGVDAGEAPTVHVSTTDEAATTPAPEPSSIDTVTEMPTPVPGHVNVVVSPPEGWEYVPDETGQFIMILINDAKTHEFRLSQLGLFWEHMEDPHSRGQRIAERTGAEVELVSATEDQYEYVVTTDHANFVFRYINLQGEVFEAIMAANPEHDPYEHIEVLDSIETMEQ